MFDLASFLPRAVMQGIPLLYGSTGEILTEKSGNLNLGIPGVMYVGGICGVIGAFFYEQSTPAADMNAFLAIGIPMLCSLLGSLLMGLLYCLLTVTLRANQNVTGLALTTFGVGTADYMVAQVKSASVEVKSVPGAEKKSVEHAPVKAPEARPAASFLAPGTVFEGSFRAKGDIEIAGELKGDVTSEGSVLLRSNLQSNITAGSVKLTGCTLIGDITANGPVTVSEDSKVTGNITAQSLLCAGEINGDIRISGNTQMDANARVSGSVVTGTISVAAGAVLNGSVEMKGAMEAKS